MPNHGPIIFHRSPFSKATVALRFVPVRRYWGVAPTEDERHEVRVGDHVMVYVKGKGRVTFMAPEEVWLKVVGSRGGKLTGEFETQTSLVPAIPGQKTRLRRIHVLGIRKG